MLTHWSVTVPVRGANRRRLTGVLAGAAAALALIAAPARATLDPATLDPGQHNAGARDTVPAGGPLAFTRAALSGSATPFTALTTPPILWALTAPSEPLMEGASGVVYAGGLLYVASYSPTPGHSSLAIVNPTTHLVVGSVTNADLDGAASLAVSGSYAYVTGVQNREGLTNANRLTIVNVSNPAEPTIVGSLQDATALYGAYDVEVAGNVAYVAAQGCVHSLCGPANEALGNRLVAVDVSDKTNPHVVGSAEDPTDTDHLDAIAVAGNRIYGTAFNTKTLTVFDVSTPTAPTIIGSVTDPLLNGINDVVVRGRYAYAIDQSTSSARLVVIDVSNAAHPTIVGSVLDTTDLSEGYWLKLVGHDVFVAVANSAAMTVVDVSDPAHPQVVASNSDSSKLGVADGIDVAGSTAYVAAFCTTPHTSCSTPSTGALTALDVTPYTALDFTAGPLADDPSSSPSFSFGAPVGGTSFSCSLDGAAATPCSSPYVPCLPLAAGAHTLSVQASTDATPATWAWTIQQAPVAGAHPACPPPTSTTTSTTTTTSSSTASTTTTSTATSTSSTPPPVGSTGPGNIAPIPPNVLTIAASATGSARGPIHLMLSCAGRVASRCHGAFRLMLRTTVYVGKGRRRHAQVRLSPLSATISYGLDTGEKGSYSIALTQAGRSALAHAKGHRVQMQVSATVIEGSTATRIVTLTLSAAHK